MWMLMNILLKSNLYVESERETDRELFLFGKQDQRDRDGVRHWKTTGDHRTIRRTDDTLTGPWLRDEKTRKNTEANRL